MHKDIQISMNKLNSIHSVSVLLKIVMEMNQIHLEVITRVALQSSVTSISCIGFGKMGIRVFMKRTLYLCI